MIDSLWEMYVSERKGHKVISKEFGFVSYAINGPECYLAEIFVKKEFRKYGKTHELLKDLFENAKLYGCEFVSANIYLSDRGANDTLGVALKVGFKVVQCGQDVLLIEKKITED